MKARVVVAVLLLFALAAMLSVFDHYGIAPIPARLLAATRWLAIAGLAAYALKKKSLTTWILVSMVVGAEFGNDWPAFALELQVLSQVFLRMVKTIVAPLLFATLVVGIAGHSNLKQVGRMGLKALIYFEVVTTIALFIGLAAINISQAGAGIEMPAGSKTDQIPAIRQTAGDLILHIFPENVAKSIAEGQILQIVVFSILFGIALAMIPENKRRPLLAFAESLAETMFKFTDLIMFFAPVGVGAAIAYTVGHMGLGILANLFKLLATFYFSLILFLLGVLLPVALIARIPVRKFIRAVVEPASIAFATTSSEAALPRAMESMEALGVPRHIVAFIIPTVLYVCLQIWLAVRAFF